MRRSTHRGVPRLRHAALAAVGVLLSGTGAARAFPLVDPDTEVTGTHDLGAAETQDLRHQLEMVNGFGAPAGGGWSFIPQLGVQEALTDNVYQAHTPRRWDLTTYISPGFNLAGDLPRATVTLSYAPTLALYARTSSLNALTQQLNGLASITLVPDLAFLDVRGLAGVSNRYGGLGGAGGVGVQAGALADSQAAAANAQGLNRQNETQNASFGLSPYLQRQFGDWGSGRIGYSLDVTRSNTLSGFASMPFPTGGQNGQTLISNEEMAHFATGDILQRLQDSVDIDLSQTQTTTDPGYYNGATGLTAPAGTHTNSSRATISDRVTYQVNRWASVFASGGYEDIHYTGVGAQTINDMIWSIGTTLIPNPNSTLTVSYGHLNGFNSLTIDGHYALTARTVLTVSYGSTLGTQLQYLQGQLNTAAATRTGQFVNGTTGGPLFTNTNALAQQDGVFRTDTLTLGAETSLDRDIISLNLSLTKQTRSGTGNNGASTSGKVLSASWIHQMRPDMTVSASLSYNQQDQGGTGFGGLGNYGSYFATAAWQYQISSTVGVSLRYSFFDRISQSSANNVYQSLLIAGLSKSF